MTEKRLDPAAFDAMFGRDRSDCTGGRRFIYALPDGSVHRCPHLDDAPIGNILDPEFRRRLVERASVPYPCASARCVAACGGLFSEQTFPDGVTHVGVDPTWKQLVGKNYLVLHAAITPVCNYSCPYCSSERWMTEFATQRKHVFTRQELIDVADWATSSFECGTTVVYGGEPTVHPGFADFVERFVTRGWITDVLTNLHLGDRMIELFERLNSESRARLRVIFAAHVNQRKFDLAKVRSTLERIREIAPHSDLVVVYVKAKENLGAMSFETLAEATRHVVTEYAQTEDIHAKIRRLDASVPTQGGEDVVLPNLQRAQEDFESI